MTTSLNLASWKIAGASDGDIFEQFLSPTKRLDYNYAFSNAPYLFAIQSANLQLLNGYLQSNPVEDW